jgi:hypothetical protein
MNFHKLIIGNRYLRYTPFWWWYRLMSHRGFRFDDYGVWSSFWTSLNGGWHDMEYKWEFEKFWGKGAKPERIVLPAKDFDALVKRLNEPPDPEVQKRFREILERVAPWDKEE